MRVSLLTSWNERCGIADYSRALTLELRRRIDMEVVPATFNAGPKTLYAAMGKALNGGDVAHIQHSYAFFGGMHPLRSGWKALADAVRVPLALTIHELDNRITGSHRLPPAVERRYKRWFNRSHFLHPAVRWWFVHSGAIREALLEMGAPEERVIYRPMPVPPAPTQAPDVEPLRRALGLSGKRVLVILGFLARRKGYDLALEALCRLPEDCVLVAAGGEHAADRTATEAALRAEAARMGLSDRFYVTGYLDEERLEQITALADVVLAPFHEMSGSASISFALARGKAVVASDLRENRALPCVRLFPVGDAAALTTSVGELLGAEECRRELELAAAHYARTHGYAAFAEETAQVYERLLRER